ncbi:hypothetical protein MSG28_015165 [Choristoneura fumiferana]|uniref:Uncharacterized protein n=1 Tax=Choristoneura fumiferana TaxID=7141 RepID=A0ACC0KZJ9_CHOFU|nr:hypothetical protein MSG28_015165 [Choristoneura fumiferana]
MLVLEQRLSARNLGRGVVLNARLVHGVEASGWRMKFALLKAEVEIEADPETYRELARRLKAANVHVRPARRNNSLVPKPATSPALSTKPVITQPAILASSNQMKPLYCQDGTEMSVTTSPCQSPGAILPDLPQAAEDPDKNCGLSKEAGGPETQAWLARNRFAQHAPTFANFSGADLLRLSRDDIIQICGLADGIRLFNALHAKRIEPRLTVYVSSGGGVYSALYLHSCRAHELLAKLQALHRANGPAPALGPALKECETVLVSGPNGARVRLTDELVRHLPDNSTYRLQRVDDALLLCGTDKTAVRCRSRSEDLEMAQFKLEKTKYDRNAESDDGLEDSRQKHRYEVIRDFDDLVDYSPTKKRIIEADANEIDEYNVDAPDENEMKEIPTEIVKTVNGKLHRYAIVPSDDDEPVRKHVAITSPVMNKKNLIATQKLHELLSTPRKLKSYASQPSVRITPNKTISPIRFTETPQRIVSSTPTRGVTPSKSCANLTSSRNPASPISPKAQQKLNYGTPGEFERPDVFVTSFREKSRERSFDLDRREASRESRREYDRRSPKKDKKSTAIIIPRVAAPPSVYSDETYKSFTSVKTVSAAAASLTIAALMLTLCGGLTTGLSFYMMYTVGRRYYLDFGVLAGFTCFLLGLLGLRSRRQQLLPNRNYISGYIVLSSFSLLSAFGLLLLLSMQPQPGTALSDITSGAVCAVSALSLFVASLGVLASYCCARDPPDNRHPFQLDHGAQL